MNVRKGAAAERQLSRKGTASEIARTASNGIERGEGGIALAHLIKLTSSRGSADDE